MPDFGSYDEFGLFHENAAEYGLQFDEAPSVRRTSVRAESGRVISALLWGTGPCEVVFIHGGAQNAHTWDTVALALRPRPLLAIDLPGHGHSDFWGLGDGLRWSPQAAASDLAAVLTAIAPRAHCVAGMSFGGKVAIALTEFVPRLVRRIVLVDSLPGSERDRSRHIADFLDGPATFASFDELLSRLTTFNPTRSPASLRRGALHNAIELPDGRWRWRHERGVRDEAHDQRLEKRAESDSALWQRLSHLEIPIMLARGMRPNSVLRDDDEARFLSAVPDGRVAHFDEAGHSIQGDMPLELAAHIRAFANLSRGNRHESHGPTQ